MSAIDLLLGRVPASWMTMLADGAVKGFLVLAIAALVAVFLRHRSSSVRHLVWTLGVVALLAMPIVSWLVPGVRVPVPGNWAPLAMHDRAHAPGRAVHAVRVVEVEPTIAEIPIVASIREVVVNPSIHVEVEPARIHVHPQQRAGHGRNDIHVIETPAAVTDVRAVVIRPPPRYRGAVQAIATAPAPPPVGFAPAWSAASFVTGGVLFGIWLIGAAAILVWMLLQRLRLAVLRRNTQPIVGGRCARMVDDIAWELGIDGEILLLAGAEDAMPMTWGVFRPVLLLPSTALTWSRERLEMVLRHELAHVARRDAMSQSMADLACAVHWYNPLVWIAAARMRVEREHACDDLVLESGPRASDYATELLDIARTLMSRPGLHRTAIAMARRSHLRQRLAAVLDEDRPRARPTGSVLAAAGLCAIGIVLPLAALEPSPLDSPASDVAPAHFRGVVMETPESVSPIVSLAPIAVQVEQSRVCRRSEDGSASINRNDDNWRIHWEGQECTVNIRIDGEFQHDAMFTEITRLAAGGMVELEERSGGRTQRLVIRPAGNDLDMQWQINGRSADFDANARDWYRLMLQEITRTTGLGADERAAAILDRDGPRGLLQEIDELRSDRVRSRYYRAILLSDRIDDVTRVGIIQEAGADIHSDREMARLLSDLSSYVATSAAVRSAVLETTSTLQSDREKVRVYTQIIGDNTLTSQQKATVITSARTVHSDRERNRLLQSVSSTTLDSPELHASYIEAAGTMSSDREKGQALARLLEAGSLNPRQLTALFEAAQTISSDRELARLLITAIETQSIDDRSRAALMRATDSISSTRERERVTSSLARRTR